MQTTDHDSTDTSTHAENGVGDAAIAEAAASPASFSVDGLSQSNRSISELIAADQHLGPRARAARRSDPLSGRVSHLVPPGTGDR